MTILRFGYSAIVVGFSATLLVACGGYGLPSGSPNAAPPGTAAARKGSYRIVYAFQGGKKGEYPSARLLGFNGNLYGTTTGGGDSTCSAAGCGTVFEAGLTGTFRVLHAFKGTEVDGSFPYAGLISDGKALYGTTAAGGEMKKTGNGTVFAISLSGKERIIHRFVSSLDGQFPSAELVDLAGSFYGTTRHGGASRSCYSGLGCGTVFTIDASGHERVLHSFNGSSRSGDGQTPYASLTPLKGMLYGTTAFGGNSGHGTVFAISPAGRERILHSFAGSPDGATPAGPLTLVNGVFYGTTGFGGSSTACSSSGCGVFFSITPAGKETVLYSFGASSSDGQNPIGALTELRGKFYGATAFGGAGAFGTVFVLTNSGPENVLHSFAGGSDGALPGAGVIAVKNTLYGTTTYGGGGNCTGSGFGGCGTIFAIPK